MGSVGAGVPVDKFIALAAETVRLQEALQAVVLRGHNDDCLFSAHKDAVVRTALPEWFEELKLVEDQL